MQSVKIYPAELGVSGWLETSTYKNHQFNHEDEILDEYDYVVVGAGYGGLGAATRLKELYPNAKIAVFEALRIGSNDSGKNAGFLIDVPHKFGDDVLTPEDEKWTVRLNVFAINKMREAVKANKLDVDWSEHGKYLAAREKRFWKILDHDREILDRMNMKYDDFDRRQLAERLGTGYYSRAIFNPGSVLINPAEVVRALFTTLGPNVHIFEKTPVMQIAGSETNPVVILLNGKKVRCRAAIVTTGPFLQELGLSDHRFCPIISYGALSRQLSAEEMEDFRGIEPWGVTAANSAGTTVRFTKDNRLFVRNGLLYGTYYTCSPEQIRHSQKVLRKAFDNRFPDHSHVNFEYVWGGMIHLTMNSKPVFGRRGNVFFAGVGEGAGIAKVYTMGHFLAEWANGIESEELSYMQNDEKPSWLPPEPICTLGATVRLIYEGFNAQGEV